HADARDFAGGLTAQTLGASPVAKTSVIACGRLALHIAMRTPAVVVIGAGKFGAAAQLRTAGEPARVIRWPAVAQACENIAAADLVAEEMRRCRHHGRIRWFFRHPVDAGEVKAAYAARLVAAGTGHVVESAFEPGR